MKNHNTKCPICGRSTFSNHNSHEICKYCGWENEDYYEGGGANELSLEEYKKKYSSIIAGDPGYIWENDWNKKVWDDSKDSIMKICDLVLNNKEVVPVKCPVCGEKTGHIYFHRNRDIRGGIWAWCSKCYSYTHMSGRVPDWWRNHPDVKEDLLEHRPMYLNAQAASIDKWVNLLSTENNSQFNFAEFVEYLYLGQEIVFTYKEHKYFIQGWWNDERTETTMVLDIVNNEPFTGYIWEYHADTMSKCAEVFLSSEIWDGKSFLQILDDVVWSDW